MRHHAGEREARRHQGDDVWVSKEPSWRQVLQPQLPSLMMPGGSKQTSRWAFPKSLIPTKLSAKYTGHWKRLRLGRVGYALIDHCNRIHLPKMLILIMASIFPHQGLYTVVLFFFFSFCLGCCPSNASAWDVCLTRSFEVLRRYIQHLQFRKGFPDHPFWSVCSWHTQSESPFIPTPRWNTFLASFFS